MSTSATSAASTTDKTDDAKVKSASRPEGNKESPLITNARREFMLADVNERRAWWQEVRRVLEIGTDPAAFDQYLGFITKVCLIQTAIKVHLTNLAIKFYGVDHAGALFAPAFWKANAAVRTKVLDMIEIEFKHKGEAKLRSIETSRAKRAEEKRKEDEKTKADGTGSSASAASAASSASSSSSDVPDVLRTVVQRKKPSGERKTPDRSMYYFLRELFCLLTRPDLAKSMQKKRVDKMNDDIAAGWTTRETLLKQKEERKAERLKRKPDESNLIKSIKSVAAGSK